MSIPIVFGLENFGSTDRFEYLGETYYRRSRCFHVWFVPILPCGSLLVTKESPGKGYKIGVCEPGAYACCRTALFHSPLCLFGWPSCLFGECCPEHCIPPVPKGDLLAYINFVRATKGLRPLASLPTADDNADESSTELFRAIAELFRRIDKNGDGHITRDEIVKTVGTDDDVRKALGLPTKFGGELEAIFEDMDEDGSHEVDFAEFANFIFRKYSIPCKIETSAANEANAMPSAQEMQRDGSEDAASSTADKKNAAAAA